MEWPFRYLKQSNWRSRKGLFFRYLMQSTWCGRVGSPFLYFTEQSPFQSLSWNDPMRLSERNAQITNELPFNHQLRPRDIRNRTHCCRKSIEKDTKFRKLFPGRLSIIEGLFGGHWVASCRWLVISLVKQTEKWWLSLTLQPDLYLNILLFFWCWLFSIKSRPRRDLAG